MSHPLCSDPGCAACNQVRATAGYYDVTVDVDRAAVPTMPAARLVTCPECDHRFDPGGPVRVTEAVEATDAKKPYGDVEYADPGYQADGKKRYPLNTEKRVRAAWSYINQAKDAAKYTPADLKKVKARIKAAMKRLDIAVSQDSTTEAVINGKRSFDDIRELVRRAIRAMLASHTDTYCWAYIVDLSDTDVVYIDNDERLWQCPYTLAGDTVTLGAPEEVVRTYAPVGSPAEEPAMEAAHDTVLGRVVEAKGNDAAGNRIFRIRVIAYGDSKNGRRYTEAVLRQAVPLYEGARVYDHHRTPEEMTSATIQGLIGHLRGAEATDDGIEADLHLFPSATHAAEALDASLAVQAEGGEPLVGVSHDVMALWRPVQESGRRIVEATRITAVNSADVVAHPSAGGMATRAVAGGIPEPAGEVPAGSSTLKEPEVPPTKAEVLAAFQEATDEELAAVGLARAGSPDTETKTTEATNPPKPGEGEPAKVTEADDSLAKTSYLARLMISSKVQDADLPVSVVESVTAALPDRITEAAVDAQIAAIKTTLGQLERAGLAPTVTATVTQEAHDKKVKALDNFFAGNFREGYKSFRHAFFDVTGHRRAGSFDEDENRLIMRESIGVFDSARRATESLTSTSWDQVLGDSITRRMIALYAQPSLQTWRQVVSEIVPVSDFRQQRRERIGGYGLLPEVAEGAPYQPLTSPTDEEAVYKAIKRGGTEDLTFEMIVNDDQNAVRMIPKNLGLAAAITLYRFVWDIFPTNAATTYDSTALFHANHNNTTAAALSQSALDAAWVKMRQQAAFGNSVNILSLEPKTLIVPTTLGPLGYQLTRSAVAIPSSSSDPADRPNMYQGMGLIVIDYWTDQNDWFLAADPNMCPTIEIGFYQGREDPELFTQADPNVGSMFDADKQTYKLRHIYNGTVLEHRGLARNTA
ncbi:MAG TPA: DUF6582 domain-containing protein [Actinophytocola sp.]|uniref:phage major capsid protein n=1 Tax=Actinophytocola sp. TaxID=1872138 RepID=UPI002DDD732F|nr:DUF6582 domain-containing protein [Actinophytocola sp.]HEV2778551.1 DUF6582 domain-containing protein [Actinophytocola sp.]